MVQNAVHSALLDLLLLSQHPPNALSVLEAQKAQSHPKNVLRAVQEHTALVAVKTAQKYALIVMLVTMQTKKGVIHAVLAILGRLCQRSRQSHVGIVLLEHTLIKEAQPHVINAQEAITQVKQEALPVITALQAMERIPITQTALFAFQAHSAQEKLTSLMDVTLVSLEQLLLNQVLQNATIAQRELILSLALQIALPVHLAHTTLRTKAALVLNALLVIIVHNSAL